MVWVIHNIILFARQFWLYITIDKFDPNPILVNIKKLKSYKFIEDRTLQPILVNPSDLVTNKLF
jgi:hypothetical protein